MDAEAEKSDAGKADVRGRAEQSSELGEKNDVLARVRDEELPWRDKGKACGRRELCR